MTHSVSKFLRGVMRNGVRRPDCVVTRSMGRDHVFRAWDLGADTFVFEDGARSLFEDGASVLFARKADLKPRGGNGMVVTVSSGNHPLAAMPLVMGRFWNLSKIVRRKQSSVMTSSILCANIVNGHIEISQRDVGQDVVIETDNWLQSSCGLGLGDVLISDRNDATLAYYHRLGQEWRIKSLAWSPNEISAAIAASRKRIGTSIVYYHNLKGVHFLSMAEFLRLLAKVRTDWSAFEAGLRELTCVYEDESKSLTRQIKYRGHHEIEFFGIRPDEGQKRLLPALECLMEGIVLRKLTRYDVLKKTREIATTCPFLLVRPTLADESSDDFKETMYMYLTGEVYAVQGSNTRAFDDRRTALPGATFVAGRPIFHPGGDSRTEVLLANLRSLLSKDEHIEYANVYELRTDNSSLNRKVGLGPTREVVYKTNRQPLERALVEKSLAHLGRNYGSWVIARVQALRALGVELSDYLLLRRRASTAARAQDYYIRPRCEGDAISDIPADYFLKVKEGALAAAEEDPQFILQLAFLAGDAAAQNAVMLKYNVETQSSGYGIGKEIYRFGYDIKAGRTMPLSVSVCSVRGAFGWADCTCNDRNHDRLSKKQLTQYAKSLKNFALKHPSCSAADVATRFWDGFEYRTRVMYWHYRENREEFDSFDPGLPSGYRFTAKWRFLLWALVRRYRELDSLKLVFAKAYLGL